MFLLIYKNNPKYSHSTDKYQNENAYLRFLYLSLKYEYLGYIFILIIHVKL